MPLFTGLRESLKQHIPGSSEPEVKRCSRTSPHRNCQMLDVLVPEDALPVGSIITSLATMTRINTEGETAAFSNLQRRTFKCPRDTYLIKAQDSNAQYLLRSRASQSRYKDNVSYEECREAIESSAWVRVWFKSTNYERPAYLVTGCTSFCDFDLTPVSGSLDGSGREPDRCIKNSEDRRNQIYSVNLVKLSYKKSFLSDGLKLCCEEQ